MAERDRGERAMDDFDDAFEEDVAEQDEEPRARSAVRSRAATRPRAKGEEKRRGFVGRRIDFISQVVAELQKVIWPTRKELVTYATVVVVFVSAIMGFVALLDYGFANVMILVFGGGTN